MLKYYLVFLADRVQEKLSDQKNYDLILGLEYEY